MEDAVRFGVSIDPRLLARFDAMIAQLGYTNRSKAIRDLIQGRLVCLGWDRAGEETVGTITMVDDHRAGELGEGLTQVRHQGIDSIISTVNMHLADRSCLEVVVLKGKDGAIGRIAREMVGAKGVRHGKLTPAPTDPPGVREPDAC